MRKEDGYKLSIYSNLDPNIDLQQPIDPEYEFSNSQLKSVLDEIFSVDPVSGFPRGDLQYYMSSEGNPVVKQWLENNLLKPRMSGGQSLSDVTDDMRAEFARKKGESIMDYQSRLMSIYDDAKSEYEKSILIEKESVANDVVNK